MRAIRNADTKPEMWVRRELHRRGYRFRLHRTDLPGRPDIVLPKYRVALQVQGCFWHGHRCQGRVPRTNTAYWKAKLGRNRQRDARNLLQLRSLGWHPRLIWECDLEAGLSRTLRYLESHITLR